MKILNETISKQLDHRTIREFKEDKLGENIFQQLMEVGRRTATANGLQASSIVRVTDQEKRKEIAKVCNQEYVARAPELLIFIVDLHRNFQIAKEKGAEGEIARDMDNFFSSFTDACLMAQNIVNAAESLDLGTVYLGSILNDSERIIEILELPELTFPVIGLGIGHPNQEPQLKPRMDMEFRVYDNKYEAYDNYLEKLADYDEEMQTYYDLRDANRRVDSFSNQVVGKFKNGNPKRQEMLNVIRRMGFDLYLKDEE